MYATVCLNSSEAVYRLTSLGLTILEIRNPVVSGEMARAACTPNHPAVAGGTYAYFETTKSLRDVLVPKGWRRLFVDGLELTQSPDDRIRIAVTAGNFATGLKGMRPQTKYSKGPAMVAAVGYHQPDLFANSTCPAPLSEDSEHEMWLLLINSASDAIYFELSRPAYIGENGHVGEWLERILFEPIRRDGEPRVTPLGTQPEIDVEVSRKAAG